MANAAILHIKGKRESSHKDAIELYTQALTCLIESQNKYLEQLDILYSEKQYAGWRDEEIVLLQSRVRSIDDFAKTIIANRGLSYNSIGCYDSALNDFAAACTIADKTRTNNSYDYISLQNNLASCEMNTGRYSAAVARLDNAMKDAAYQYGENSFIYACCLLNYSKYHYFVGQYNEGVEKACKALDIYMDIELSLLDENYISAQLAISDFCVVLNLYDSALNWANMAYNNLAQLESTTTLFPICLIQMGKIYMKQNKIKEGTEAFLNAKQILDTECDEKSQYNVLAHWENEFGTSLWELGYLKSARIHLNNVLYYLFNTENYGSPIATHALYKMGVSHIVDNTHPDDDYFHNALSCMQHYFVRNIAFITELDRILLWNQIERYKDILFTLYANGSSSTYLFDYLLFSKSILLKTSINFGKSILNSSDEELIGKYHQLLAMKDAENRRVQLGRIDMAPSQDIPRLEREILSQVAGLEDYLADLNCTYVDIANALGDNEVAIEFVDYINLKTDKKHYVALVMRKGWETPKYIDLFEGEDLDALLEYSPQALYSKGTIGTQLYDLVWAPLASEIKDGDTIYFSPSGELYTLGIEAILSPQGEPLNQLYNMYRLTSTREIFNLSDNAKISNAALYGGLKYDVTPEQMAQMSSTAHKNYDVKSVDFDGGSQERAGWSYLPGTEREVEYISELMQSQNIAHSKYIGEFGNEESFKMLSGKGCNVLHLATHGFFVDKQDVSKKKYLESMINDSKESQIIDPMYRSGLLFAGSNNRWTGLELESGVEDGIMTAAEIATMDLTETDIVVLSACDTGLGDVSGDGVFGLQRAFKQAGVQTIVMSLWRVDDAATELMMTTFYNNLLSGKSKRDSFIIAQNTLRNHEQFSNPYYWAAFVMLD